MQVLRLGRISSIDYELGTARVTYEDREGAVTTQLPFLASEYLMPAVGDAVVTAHFSATSAVILGRLYSDSNRPAESGAGLFRKELAADRGEAYIRYDADSQTLNVHGAGVDITAQDGRVTIDGDLAVTGTINGEEA